MEIKKIQGILVDKEEIKLEMFADDVTAFLRLNTHLLKLFFILLICSVSVLDLI